MIIGLNPPFGVNAALADRFIKHAAKFRPRLMMLICPSNTIVPNGYKVIHEDLNLCKDKYVNLSCMDFERRLEPFIFRDQNLIKGTIPHHLFVY